MAASMQPTKPKGAIFIYLQATLFLQAAKLYNFLHFILTLFLCINRISHKLGHPSHTKLNAPLHIFIPQEKHLIRAFQACFPVPQCMIPKGTCIRNPFTRLIKCLFQMNNLGSIYFLFKLVGGDENIFWVKTNAKDPTTGRSYGLW